MPLRRRLLVVMFACLVVMPFSVRNDGNQGRSEVCAKPATALRVGNTVACVHSDEAPPGVDVTDRPSTAELQARPGAGEAAYEAAQELGVPAPVEVAANASSPSVSCDGDGQAGYRVQGMYVVEAGKTNRYAALLDSLRIWAAGTDDVVNRSAALTGGVRHIRYVTTSGAGGTCVADILNVTVPVGSMASFGTTVAAVQAMGYTTPSRKYLMWTDANVLCGVASLYTSDGASQSNPNNGSYPQYARVDSGCWGYGDGANQHSVEAHELMHTLGGVQNSAPHSTNAGHCWDESDSMCYSDGGTHAMVQICTANKEYFFDCNNDDYFSTYPDPGNYLATHWNAADSRFLIGGGDGSGGGSLGTPTVLGATISVNNPAVPGLSTQVSVAPQLPSGRTLTSVKWTSKRTDCTFSTPTAVQSTVTCNAGVGTTTTVTAALVDSSGATKSVTGSLTFTVGTSRPVDLAFTAAGQSGSSASVCTSAVFPLRAVVLDRASQQPVKGLAVAFTKQSSTALAASSAGSATTGVEGTSSVNQTAATVTAYTAKTAAGTVYAASTVGAITATPGLCAPVLTGSKDTSATYYGDPVIVTGTLTRTIGAADYPVAGTTLAVKNLPTGATRTVALGTVVTTANGTYQVTVKPTASGVLSVELPASAGYLATRVELGSISVELPQTSLTAAIDKDDVGYGSTVVATGRLDRVAGGSTTPLKAAVSVLVTPPGKAAVKVASGSTTVAGTYSIAFPLKVSGSLSVAYAGVAGQPARTVVVGDVVAGTWTTQLTSAASSMSIGLGTSTTISGTLTRSYGGSTVPAPGLKIALRFTPTGSSIVSTLASATTTATGSFSAKVAPRTSGILRALLAGVPGYVEATGDPLLITVN